MTDILTVKDLRAYYLMNYYGVQREVRAVDDISLTIHRDEIYGLAGESSSGKTTLIKVLAAAIRPPLTVVAGSVKYQFDDLAVDVYGDSKETVDAIRWKYMSYIMQGSMSLLNPVRRIEHSFDDFAFRQMRLPRAQFWRQVREHLRHLDLGPEILRAYPHELSGGMRQRVVIALATVCRPQFIIADEPTTALDVVVQKDVLALIGDVRAAMGSSVIFVTHDMAVHANMAHRVGIMYAGRLVEEGPTRTIFTRPKHPYTAHLVASLPSIGDTTRKPALEGRPPSLADPPSGCRFHPRCPLAVDRCKVDVPPLVTIGSEHRAACFRSDDVVPLAPAPAAAPVEVVA